jgi:peptidoglycan/xylan/chitin deacetylase (PgdA/CDA1 family)
VIDAQGAHAAHIALGVDGVRREVSARRLVLLSFDAEEFDIPLEYGRTLGMDEQLRVGGEGMRRTLGLLERCDVPATFFCTAVFARAFPDLIERAVGAGHEIASHGFAHSTFTLADLRASRDALDDVSAKPGAVVGFRRARMAPTDPRAVADAGYAYNSSENPIWLPGRYNRFFEPRRAYFVANARVSRETPSPSVASTTTTATTASSSLLHIPASATPLVRWPLFWLAFKNAPLWATKLATRWCLRADGYAALYFHPWELCELTREGDYNLPRMVRALDGARLEARLERYIRWAKGLPDTSFATYAELAERLRAGRGAFTPQHRTAPTSTQAAP